MIALLASATLVAAAGRAQQVRAVPPVRVQGAIAAPQTPPADEDAGIAVDMFDNPNLDRYLLRAQKMLEREDYASAIELLQQVIEGRTSEVVASGPETEPSGGAAAEAPSATKTGPQKKGEGQPEPAGPEQAKKETEAEVRLLEQVKGRRRSDKAPEPAPVPLDARNAVFSQDGRLYRPVRRLCHELLSRLPAVGIEIYRAMHEVAAEELLQAALRDGSLSALEQVANQYFITLPAGRAMALLADRLMHDGRYRAAVLVLSDLTDTYPADNRRRLGIDEAWCRFKIALCLQLAGEQAAAHDAVQNLATAFPGESLRVLGELHAVKDLPTDALFARDVAATRSSSSTAASTAWLGDESSELVPLWQMRFRNPEPYRDPKPSNNDRNTFFSFDGVTTATMPHPGRYGPATWVAFGPRGSQPNGLPQALFFEHYRLRTADATTGILTAQGDGNDEPPLPRENHPRVRVAASDFALLRPVTDGQRTYAVLGHARATTTSVEPYRTSTLVAYEHKANERGANARLWSSEQWFDGDGGLRDVTFLAAPTVFGERLLLPALRHGKYSLECLERKTGRPVWRAQLHGGGTPFFKAPGCPVVVQGGIAYVATNAGCIAAVDAFTGDLRWIRRYERSDPRRKSQRPRRGNRNDDFGMRAQFGFDELPTFLPNDLIAADGLVVVAPCDGGVLLCVDGATGHVQWMVDGATRYAPYGTLRSLLGRSDEDLFALSDTHLVAIGFTGGLVKWAKELPAWNGAKNSGRGRGAVWGNLIVIPGEREVLVYGTDGKLMRRAALPPFDPSRDPLKGSANVVVEEAWLALGYQGGVEVFSSRPALRQLAATATDVRTKADLLMRAGDIGAARTVLTAAIAASTDAATRQGLGSDLLALVRDRAAVLVRGGDLPGALALLDSVLDSMREANVRLHWHLARVELCKEGGDLLGHEREQNRLYDYMEGKG